MLIVKFMIGLGLIMGGIALYWYEVNCPFYSTVTDTLECGLFEFDVGNVILMGAAAAGIAAEFILAKVFGVTDYSYAAGWLWACLIGAKLGFITLPLLFETLLAVMIGMELTLPQPILNVVGAAMDSAFGKIVFAAATLITAMRINTNMN